MAKNSRRKKKKERARKKARPPPPTSGPASVHDITDDILEIILLRLDSSICVVRAAFTCKRWRRIVANAGFLRRFRSLHTPPVFGHYYAVNPPPPLEGTDVFVPSSPVTIDSGRFSLDFLPNSGSWKLADSRGSLLLLIPKKGPRYRYHNFRKVPDLIVCEPLTRRYQGILRPAEFKHWRWLGAFLLDGAAADELGGCISMSNFRVLSAIHDDGTPRACVFSSGSDGGWHVVQSAMADDIHFMDHYEIWTDDFVHFVGRACGSLYWAVRNGNLLVLDEGIAEFSLVVMPDDMRWPYANSNFRVVCGEGGAARVLRLTGDDLEVRAQVDGSAGWAVDKSLQLQEATRGLPGRKEEYLGKAAKIVAVGAGFVVLTPVEERWLFSVDLETMEVEREHERNRYAGKAYPYACLWPPPALHACVDDGSRRRRR